ncbi:MAG TPA: hypothetical protein VIY47_08810 [Ignavibacteriaceae bacterium]
MIVDIIKDAILANVGPLKSASKGWQKRHCMLCHTQGQGKDTRNRLGIQFNPQKILVHCFNCKFSAGFEEGKELSKQFKFFLKQIHVNEKFIEQIEFEIFKQKNKIDSIRVGAESKIEDKEEKFKSLFQKWKPMDLPKDSLPIKEWLECGLTDPEFLKVVNYLLSRRFFDLENYYWTPVTEFNLNQRFIIPYYYRNKIVGFTSRLSYDTTEKKIPKYYQQCPQDFVYNLDNQQAWSRKYVIVNEGVLDAKVVDGVGILGELGQTKIDIINRLQKEIIVCPDRDKNGWDLVKAAIDNNWAVAFPLWGNHVKDAAHASEIYGRLLTTHSIISSAVTGKEKIELTWKISQNERQRQR